MLIASYGNPPSDPLSWNRCKDLLKSNAVYVEAPSVSLYMQHIKCFDGDHVVSKKLLQDGPVTKSRGHFKTVYSAEALCWACGSDSHDPRDCKMLTSALADYRSKHLHKGRPVVAEGSATTTRADALLVVGDLLHATTRVENTTAITTRVAGTTACTKTDTSRITARI